MATNDYRGEANKTFHLYGKEHSTVWSIYLMQGQFNDMCAVSRRQAILTDYSDEILAIYETVAESTQANIPPPSEWDNASTEEFVHTVVLQVLSHSISDNDDFFQHGCDRWSVSLSFTCGNADSFWWFTGDVDSKHPPCSPGFEFDIRQTMDNFTSISTQVSPNCQSSWHQ